jgi:WD40 repeat protein
VNRVLSLDFSDDGKLLATGGGDPSRSGELMIWDVGKQSLLRQIQDAHSDTVLGVDFSQNGQYLLSGASDKFAKLFEVATGNFVRSFEGHTHHVLDVSWKLDGTSIATAGADNVIKVWNVETGEQRRTIGGYSKQVTSVQYIGVGENVVSCSGDKQVRFHRTGNGQAYRKFSGGTDFMYTSAAARSETSVIANVNNEATIVIAGGEDGVLRMWNGGNEKSIRIIEPPKPPADQTAQADASGK